MFAPVAGMRQSRRFSTAGPRLALVTVALLSAGLATAGPGVAPVNLPASADADAEALLLLLPEDERHEIEALPPETRMNRLAARLADDPLPETAGNELAEGVSRRRRLAERELLGWSDDRARLLFLQGPPAARETVECGQVFRPLEIWTYPGQTPDRLLLYRRSPAESYRLWLPTDGKRALYTPEMEYVLEQWEELRRYIVGKRIDLRACDRAAEIDRLTGVDGLTGFKPGRPRAEQFAGFLAPPADLAAWARTAAATPVEEHPALPLSEVRLSFPETRGQRLVVRMLTVLPPDAPLAVAEEEEKRELRLAVDGVVERDGALLESFRERFVLPPATGAPLVLATERALRPGGPYVLRLRLRDEVGGAVTTLARAFTVPAEATPEPEPPLPEGAIVALGEELGRQSLPGRDSLLLVPPAADVVFGLWRAEAIVTGERIRRVVFYLDGRAQLTRTSPPWSAELRLPNLPREQVVRAEGLDAAGELVAADEVVLNQPQGEPRITILEPPRGSRPTGEVRARAAVVVPEGRRVERVEFRLGDELVAVREHPPWEARIEVPAQGEIAFLAATAIFSDGARAEDVRFLRLPEHLDEIDVNLVEIFATVLDNNGRPVEGLTAADFTLLDQGRPQPLARFEPVRDLPLVIGITLDLSGSMQGALAEAKAAAAGFLETIVTPKDRAFAVGFAERPWLLAPLTPDPRAVIAAFEELPAVGWTALHDAVVFSLHYFRGIAGRKALVILSDGDDTSSAVAARDALEYARRSGVVIYTVGLDLPRGAVAIRAKLRELANETGGQAFFIAKASELTAVYREIDRELRSQYLLAFSPATAGGETGYRKVEVRVRDGRLKVRTARGYYP